MSIQFFKADVSFRLSKKEGIATWLKSVARKEGFSIAELNIILCSDEYLFHMNKQYLQHHTYTDIITFDFSEGKSPVSGELYISVERVKDNANKLNITVQEELHRVMVHGVLHLCSYSDKRHSERAEMRRLEDLYLSLRKFL
jgi:probable rRNA maturation factor